VRVILSTNEPAGTADAALHVPRVAPFALEYQNVTTGVLATCVGAGV